MMIGQLETTIWKSATAPAHFRSASVEARPDDVEIRPFETTLGFIAAARSPQIGSAAPVHAGRYENAAVRTRASQQAFEAFALQSFVEAMLPEETAKLFGAGSAGKMWKSLLAEKLAEQLSASGRLQLIPERALGTSVQRTPTEAQYGAGAAPFAGIWRTTVIPAGPAGTQHEPSTIASPWTTEPR